MAVYEITIFYPSNQRKNWKIWQSRAQLSMSDSSHWPGIVQLLEHDLFKSLVFPYKPSVMLAAQLPQAISGHTQSQVN